MRNKVTWLVILAILALVGVMAMQYQTSRRVASDLARLRQELAAASPQVEPPRPARERSTSDNGAILRRLAALEETVAQLARNSDYLMERGQLPLATNKVANLFTKFMDPTASDRDRLLSLRLLRRNGGMTEEAVAHAVNWAQGATNADTRDDILSALEGLTNSVLRDPLLAFAANDPDSSVREQALDSLQRFISDPKVEAQFWEMINDPDEDIRDTAREGIIEGPKTEGRLAALQERVSNANSPLEERLLAWRALRKSNHDGPETTAALAQLAVSSQDPLERAQLVRAFDDAIERATPRDSAFLPPLVQSLQDPSPLVREPAANALRDFIADPNVQKWLRWAAENDPDPAVRKEAAGAFLR